MYDYSPLWQTMREMGITTYRLIKEGIDKKRFQICSTIKMSRY